MIFLLALAQMDAYFAIFCPFTEAVPTWWTLNTILEHLLCAAIVLGAGNTKMHKIPPLTLGSLYILEKHGSIDYKTKIYHGGAIVEVCESALGVETREPNSA